MIASVALLSGPHSRPVVGRVDGRRSVSGLTGENRRRRRHEEEDSPAKEKREGILHSRGRRERERGMQM